jgi:hypothetical protein
MKRLKYAWQDVKDKPAGDTLRRCSSCAAEVSSAVCAAASLCRVLKELLFRFR